MISKDDILTIYSDCRGILLLQEDENAETLVDTLISDYLGLSDIDLNKIATEAGFRDSARFLRASEYFHVYKKGDRVLIRLFDPRAEKTKKKVPLAKQNANSCSEPPQKEKVTPEVEPMEVDPAPKENDVIIIDDEEDQEAVVPQFVVQISEDPRYESALKEHARTVQKDPKDFEQKDLRYLINARKALYTKEWKNDMFLKLYPEEIENQEKRMAEKFRQSMLRQYELQK